MSAAGSSPKALAGAWVSEDNGLTVLLVGFGGPETLGEVEGFVESVLGRKAPEHVILSAMDRYRAIGGGSPLPAMTRRQADLVAAELGRRGLEARVHVGMMHARPTIDVAVAQIVAEGAEDLIVISLAPYRCEVSTDAYEAAVEHAVDGRGPRLHFGPDWNLAPGYVDALTDMLAKTLEQAPPNTPVVFAAHSLPVRMIDKGDPYADQLTSTAGNIAERLGLEAWQLAYQSVSAAAREPWLGPSVEEVMARLAAGGAKSVLVDPIGFISDHVETLYDNDIEHRARAEELGLAFYRCRCLNEHPGLIKTLADLTVATSDHG
jgi:protoporphyrin/coproporphyrin ferrochelatase